MADTPPGDPEPLPPGPRFQFTLGKIFLVTTLVAVLGGAWAGMTRVRQSGEPWEFSTLMTAAFLVLAAPLAALIVASFFRHVMHWLEQRRR